MIHLLMTPQTSVIRAYSQPDGYEKRMPYQAAVTVTHMSATKVYLHVGVGNVDRETWEKVLELLRSQGVESLEMERHGVMKTITL